MGRLCRAASRRARHRHHRGRQARRQVLHRRSARSAGGRSRSVAAPAAKIDPGQVAAQWTPYQSLRSAIRAETAARRRSSRRASVTLTIRATASWRMARRRRTGWTARGPRRAMLPAGRTGLRSLRRARTSTKRMPRRWNDYLDRLAPSPASSSRRQPSATASSSSRACAIRSPPIREWLLPRRGSIRSGSSAAGRPIRRWMPSSC